jgi:hypothetical protein
MMMEVSFIPVSLTFTLENCNILTFSAGIIDLVGAVIEKVQAAATGVTLL